MKLVLMQILNIDDTVNDLIIEMNDGFNNFIDILETSPRVAAYNVSDIGYQYNPEIDTALSKRSKWTATKLKGFKNGRN